MTTLNDGKAITACFSNVALTGISGAATTHSYSAGVVAIRGKVYTLAANSSVATPTTDAATGAAITVTANKARVVVFCVDGNNGDYLYAGPTVDMDSSGTLLDACEFPAIPNDRCPIAYFLVKGGATLSGTFTVGSSNWNTTGMTYTVVNVAQLPDRPSYA